MEEQLYSKFNGTRLEVWNEIAVQTRRGIKKGDLLLIKNKIVTVKEHRKNQEHGVKKLSKWVLSMMQARIELQIKGFQKCKKGTRLYARTKEIHS